jgi:hypothetical protein
MIEAISAILALLSGGIFLAHIVNAYQTPRADSANVADGT